MLNMLRVCSKCGIEKPLSQFHRHAINPLGRRPNCKECCNARNKLYYERNREEITQWQRDYNKTEHRKKYSRDYQRVRARRMRDIDATRPRPLHCESCGSNGAETVKGIVFDHCHQTGLFRGWLCNRCNRVAGMCKDDAAILQKLAEYLRLHKK